MTSFLAGILIAADETPVPTTPEGTGPDWLMIGMIVVLAILVFFMFRNSRKRKKEQEQLATTMVPGVEVMTNFGLFGTIVSLDETANTAQLEVSPGNIIKVHRQTLVRVVDPAAPAEAGAPRSVEEAAEIAEREYQERQAAANAGEPQFGERLPEAETGAPDKADEDDTKK